VEMPCLLPLENSPNNSVDDDIPDLVSDYESDDSEMPNLESVETDGTDEDLPDDNQV